MSINQNQAEKKMQKQNNPTLQPGWNVGVGGIMCFLCNKIEADMQNLLFKDCLCMSSSMKSWRL